MIVITEAQRKEQLENTLLKLTEALKAGRTWKRYTQEEVCKRLPNMNVSAYSKVENGKQNVSLQTLVEVCNALGMEVVLKTKGSTVQEFKLN